MRVQKSAVILVFAEGDWNFGKQFIRIFTYPMELYGFVLSSQSHATMA
jgi:hypothetical protein